MRRLVFFVGLALVSSFVARVAGAQNVTGAIAASRSSCVAPCFVRFDATNTVAGGTTKPFHDVDYYWDFGDPHSGSWTTGAASKGSAGWSRNMDLGPLAGHVFDPDRWGDAYDTNCGLGSNTCRQYTVTLKAIYGAASDTRSVVISVNKPDAQWASTTVCLNVSSDSNFTGCPSGATNTKLSATDVCPTISSQVSAGKRRVLLKGGASYTCSSNPNLNVAGPALLSSYGTGMAVIPGMGVTLNQGDWRVTLLDMQSAAVANGTNYTYFNNLVYRTHLHGSAGVVVYGLHGDSGLVENELGPCSSSGGCYAFFGAGFTSVGDRNLGDRTSFIGNNVHDIQPSGAVQHVYRIYTQPNETGATATGVGKMLFAHETMGPNNVAQHNDYLVQTSGNITSRYYQFEDIYEIPYSNSIATVVQISGGTGTNAPGPNSFSDVLVENSFFDLTHLTGAQIDTISINTANHVTIRNNLAIVGLPSTSTNNMLVHVNNPGGGLTTNPNDVQIYNNSAYSTSVLTACTAPVVVWVGNPNATNIGVKNNLYWPAVANKCDLTSTGGNITVGTNWSRKTGELTVSPFASAAPAIPDDFKLAACSGAHCPIDAGTSLAGVYLDFWRGVRGNPISIGAHEPGAPLVQGSSGPDSPPPPPVLLTGQ